MRWRELYKVGFTSLQVYKFTGLGVSLFGDSLLKRVIRRKLSGALPTVKQVVKYSQAFLSGGASASLQVYTAGRRLGAGDDIKRDESVRLSASCATLAGKEVLSFVAYPHYCCSEAFTVRPWSPLPVIAGGTPGGPKKLARLGFWLYPNTLQITTGLH